MQDLPTLAPARPRHLTGLYHEYAESRLSFARGLARQLSPYRSDDWQQARVLDVGCGDGRVAAAFAERGARVIAFDYDAGRVRTAQRASQDEGGNTVFTVLQADAQALPFSSGSFDVALLSDVLEHVNRPDLTLLEIARVLRTGGFVYIGTTNRSSVLNLIADPHYNLPGISLMPRRMAAWYVTRLVKVSASYNIGTYFWKRQLLSLASAAGLTVHELHSIYEEKIRSCRLTTAFGRGWLVALLRYSPIRRGVLLMTRTWLFNRLIQPGWDLVAFKLPAEETLPGPRA
jgi:ubiquinone/menaquinone biosynthesis C-methylase UbiE